MTDRGEAPGQQSGIEEERRPEKSGRQEHVPELMAEEEPADQQPEQEHSDRQGKDDGRAPGAGVSLPESREEEGEQGCQAGVSWLRPIRRGHLEAN